MQHVRTQIRNKVAELLTGLQTTGNNVFPSRVHPMTAETMPGLCVYVKSEKATTNEDNLLIKTCDLIIDAYVKGSSFDEALDTIHAEVEYALYQDESSETVTSSGWNQDDDSYDLVDTIGDTEKRYLGGLALELNYVGADSGYVGDAAVPHGVLRITYTVTYATTKTDATTVI